VNAEIDRIRTLSTQEAPKAWSALEQKVMRESAPLVPVFYDKTIKLNGSRVGGLYLDGVLGGTSLVNAYVK
jgi:peptide/nickel transport system substrate-binding protein